MLLGGLKFMDSARPFPPPLPALSFSYSNQARANIDSVSRRDGISTRHAASAGHISCFTMYNASPHTPRSNDNSVSRCARRKNNVASAHKVPCLGATRGLDSTERLVEDVRAS